MPVDKRKSKSEIIKELMYSYEKTGKVGNSTPKTKKEALKQAQAIAYSAKKESKSEGIISKVHSLLEFVMGGPTPMMIGNDEADILSQFGKDTPHYMLDIIKGQLEKKGFDLKVQKEDRDFFHLIISKNGDIIKKVKVPRNKIVDGEITARDLM